MAADSNPLPQTFIHKTPTHTSHIRWTRLGNPTSPPLIFIHGTPWSSIVWRTLAASLATRYNIYLYDHPGFGDSPPPNRHTAAPDDTADPTKTDLDASLVHRASASAALITHWHLTTPPHIISHDNGGLVALRLLLQHNLPLASLCLIDVVALPPFGLPFFKLVAENEAVFRAIPPLLLEGVVRAYVRSATFKPLPAGVEDVLCKPWGAGGTQGPERFLREMVQAHWRDAGGVEGEYARVGGLVPTKIVWGGEDAWLPAETAHRLKEALGAEEVVVIEEAGHLVHYDQPGRLALEVGLWLGKHGRE